MTTTQTLYKCADAMLADAYSQSLHTLEKLTKTNDPLARRLWPLHRDKTIRLATCFALLARESHHTQKEQVQVLLKACMKAARPRGMSKKTWKKLTSGFVGEVMAKVNLAVEAFEEEFDDEP